jgi:large subunit ribosomal protein L10
VQKSEKEQVVAELTDRLRATPSLIVADYRGLTNGQLETLRDELIKHGARFSVVKNTLTRRAAEAAGADALLTLLEGPSAIAFVESDGDPVAVAKALRDTARETRVLIIRGGLLEGRSMSSDEVESLASLPPLETLRGQVLGAVIAPLNAIAGLINAALQNLVGLIDARIDQLGGPEADASAADEPSAEAEPVETTEAPEPTDAAETADTQDSEAEPSGDDAAAAAETEQEKEE